jgi:D-aminopeptidase
MSRSTIGTALLWGVATLVLSLSPTYSEERPPDKRARDYGIPFGFGEPGPLNAITDVEGVLVGQVTLREGNGKLVPGQGPVRTGVTAILPHGGDLWNEKVPAAGFVLNGNGEMTGLHWVNEHGALEVPILMTNTLSVPRVADGVITYMLEKYPDIGIGDDVVLPVVGECDDSTLNDIRGRHVRAEHAVRAIREARSGPVEEGAVGAGTGMIAYDFKGGIGTSSRRLPEARGGFTVGVLVNANLGLRRNLLIAGVPVGEALTDIPEPEADAEGSILIVVATDAPLLHRQLLRLARRASLGLARTGTVSRHGSGDLFIAFSTGLRVPHYPQEPFVDIRYLEDAFLNPLFEAVVGATEEAIINALVAAETTVGRDGHTARAIPMERVVEILSRHRRLVRVPSVP